MNKMFKQLHNLTNNLLEKNDQNNSYNQKNLNKLKKI